jgi:hypothetical protein
MPRNLNENCTFMNRASGLRGSPPVSLESTKGVGPSTTLACLAGGRMISVKMDGHDSKEAGSKGCVLLYYSSSKFESSLTVYWNGVGLP